MDRAEREATIEEAINGFARVAAMGRRRLLPAPASRKVSFDEFRQRVRRHRPSDLLLTLGAMAAAAPDGKYDLDSPNKFSPWAIALIARESILWGNEHRKPGVTSSDLVALYNAHSNIYEPAHTRGDDITLSILTRFIYQQFPLQESLYEEMARTHSLLVAPLDDLDLDLDILSPSAWEDIFGAPLPEVAMATFFLQVAADRNAGTVDSAWLTREDISGMFVDLTPGVVAERLERLSSTREEFKAAYEAVPKPPGLSQFSYNPLVRRPFVKLADGRFVAPLPRLILRTITPNRLYYDGIGSLGQAFTSDLGTLTEHYVGRLLRAIEPVADVRGEIEFGGRKSIDWFLTLPSTLVMFEVKSDRYRLFEQAAVEGSLDAITSRLNRAHKQLAATSTALDDARPEFSGLDAELPRLGIIVTAEPFYLANSEYMQERLDRAEFPVIVASLRDLEHLTAIPLDDLDAFLTRIRTEGFGDAADLTRALGQQRIERRSPVLEAGWNAYPWLTRDDEQTDD